MNLPHLHTENLTTQQEFFTTQQHFPQHNTTHKNLTTQHKFITTQYKTFTTQQEFSTTQQFSHRPQHNGSWITGTDFKPNLICRYFYGCMFILCL